VEPAPLETALLYKILKAQRETLEFLKDTTPEGFDVPLPQKTVTSAKPEIIDVSHVPLRSVYFLNKGPNTVYYRINDDPTENSLEDRESIKVERPRRAIVKITLRTDAGQSTTVKMNGQY